MATNYPGGLDNFTNPTGTDTLGSATVPHASQHADVNDAIEAIEAALGANPAGSALALEINQISATGPDVLSYGTGSGEVDSTATGPSIWFKFDVGGTPYGIPGYPINS